MFAALVPESSSAPFIVVIVIAAVAVGAALAVLLVLRRSMRLSPLTLGISTVVAIGILAGAVLVGTTITAPETPLASEVGSD